MALKKLSDYYLIVYPLIFLHISKIYKVLGFW